MKVSSTRLRFLSGASPEALEGAISALPFKIEVKGIYPQSGRVYVWFVLPDFVDDESWDKFVAANGDFR